MRDKRINWVPGSDPVLWPGGTRGGHDIYYSHLVPFFERNIPNNDILEDDQFRYLRLKTLFKARAFYALQHKDGDLPRKGLRILCDENVSREHLYSCSRFFDMATSVNFEGITSFKDAEVWQHAVGRVDLIVTRDIHTGKDYDLTEIARHAWGEAARAAPDEPVNLPMLVHLTAETFVGRGFVKALERHAVALFELHEQKAGPVLLLGEHGIHVVVSRAQSLVPRDQKKRHELAVAAVAKEKGDLPPSKRRGRSLALKYRPLFMPDPREWAVRDDPAVLDKKRQLNARVRTVLERLDERWAAPLPMRVMEPHKRVGQLAF